MINPCPAAPNRTLRIVLTVLALAVSGAAAFWLADLSHEVALLRAARVHWHEDAFTMIAFFAVAVPVGTLLHTGPAAAAGLPVRRGWVTAAGVLAYGVVVTALAGLVAPLAPPMSGTRHDPGGLYPAWLTCVLLSVAVVACAGGLFPRTWRRKLVERRKAAGEAGQPPSPEPLPDATTSRDETPTAPPRISNALFVTGVIGWAVGGILLAILVLAGGIVALVG